MAQTQPNVIWVLTDQQRAMMLSCNGDPNVHTPNIAALADMGVNFTRAVSGYPLCCPFRGSMLTSRYPHECVPGHEYQMPPEMPTIADVFNENGYHTAYFGKWHLDGFHEREGRAALHTVPPERRGHFQQWVGYENNNSQYDCWVHGGQGETAFCRRLPGYETDCLTDLLLEHLEERAAAKTPFFAVLSVQPPHDPYLAPPEYMARFNPQTLRMRENVPHIPALEERARREYAGACAMVENMDWNMGRIRNKLWETGLAENTHILFFSDHGDMHGSHGMFLKTHPYEESLRIPFVIGGASHYTGVTRAGGLPHQPRGHRPDHARAVRNPPAGVDAGHGLLRRAPGRDGAERPGLRLHPEERGDADRLRHAVPLARHRHARRLEVRLPRGNAVPDVQPERGPLGAAQHGAQFLLLRKAARAQRAPAPVGGGDGRRFSLAKVVKKRLFVLTRRTRRSIIESTFAG